MKKLKDELTERKKEIDILKGETSKQIYQITDSIVKFLDKETGTLGEGIRSLFKEQGITIFSILMALGMILGVLIEALPGDPSASTTASESTTTSEKKGRARKCIKKQIKSPVTTIWEISRQSIASLPGIISSILSWLLNRAKEVIEWLSQNLWALITGV